MLRSATRLTAAMLLGLPVAFGQAYTDSFEGTTLNPFWIVDAAPGNSDTVGPSTDLARTGSSSLKFVSQAGTNRWIYVGHTFPSAVRGTFTVYLYDVSAGSATLYEYLALRSTNSSRGADVGVDDYEPYCYKAKIWDGTTHWGQNPPTNPCAYNDAGTWNNTNVPRTVGWHRFDIETTSTSTTVKIDGQTMVTSPALDFDIVYLFVQAPSWRPSGIAYFDDFSFAPGPVAPAYKLKLLYDPTKAVKSGAVIPLKLQVLDASDVNISASTLVLHATSLVMASTVISEAIQDAGNSNPDSDFRFDPTLGDTGGYIFNLKTTGLSTGTYNLYFTIGNSPETSMLQFQVR